MVLKAILFGASGRLGKRVAARLDAAGYTIWMPPREIIDLTNGDDVEHFIDAINPDVVINCSARNGLEMCRQYPLTAIEVNAVAVGRLAHAVEQLGARFIHISSDYAKSRWDVYGATKAAGEDLALVCGNAVTLRVMSIYDPRDMDGALGAIKQYQAGRGSKENPIKVVEQVTAPTYTGWLANIICKIVAVGEQLNGIYDLAPEGEISKIAFSQIALQKFLGVKDAVVVAGDELEIPRPIRSVFPVGSSQPLLYELGITYPPHLLDNLRQSLKIWQVENHVDGISASTGRSA